MKLAERTDESVQICNEIIDLLGRRDISTSVALLGTLMATAYVLSQALDGMPEQLLSGSAFPEALAAIETLIAIGIMPETPVSVQ